MVQLLLLLWFLILFLFLIFLRIFLFQCLLASMRKSGARDSAPGSDIFYGTQLGSPAVRGRAEL